MSEMDIQIIFENMQIRLPKRNVKMLQFGKIGILTNKLNFVQKLPRCIQIN